MRGCFAMRPRSTRSRQGSWCIGSSRKPDRGSRLLRHLCEMQDRDRWRRPGAPQYVWRGFSQSREKDCWPIPVRLTWAAPGRPRDLARGLDRLADQEPPVQLTAVTIQKPEAITLILGQAHFIKTVEDPPEALVTAVPGISFGLAFC